MTEVPAAQPGRPAPERDAKAWAAARSLEAGFVSEMLKAAGLDQARETFGGGIGEEQFLSFLRAETADAIVESGGFGLAESIYRAIAQKVEDGG